MHLLFADESGTPPKPGVTSPKYFVVGAVIVPEAIWHRLRDALLGMKIRRKIRGELKWRYFAPGNTDPANPMRHLDQVTRDSIRTEVYQIIAAESTLKTMAAVCSPSAAYRLPSVTDQEGLYHLTYKTITERFQYFLQDISKASGQAQRGIVIADHRGGADDKRLQRLHNKLLYASGTNISTYSNLVESLFLQQSHMSVGIQLADMVAGAVWRQYERADGRWFNLIQPTLRTNAQGNITGYGIIKVPKAGWV